MDPGAIHVRTMYHADTPCDITHPAYRVCACALALVSAAETGWAGGHDQKAGTKPTTPTTTAAGIRSVLILFHLRTAPYSAIHMLYIQNRFRYSYTMGKTHGGGWCCVLRNKLLCFKKAPTHAKATNKSENEVPQLQAGKKSTFGDRQAHRYTTYMDYHACDTEHMKFVLKRK